MSDDDYPDAWKRPEDRTVPGDEPNMDITKLRSGAYTEPREPLDQYPPEWNR